MDERKGRKVATGMETGVAIGAGVGERLAWHWTASPSGKERGSLGRRDWNN